MTTPFKNVSSEIKDDFNFCQSQLRIQIEYAFGQLVHRWSMLRRPLSTNLSIKKVTALTHTLYKLHNFCIDQNEERVSDIIEMDKFIRILCGYMPLSVTHDGESIPDQLLSGGDHWDDCEHIRRRKARKHSRNRSILPRDDMVALVRERNLQRLRVMH